MEKEIIGEERFCFRQGLSLALDAELEDKVSGQVQPGVQLVRFTKPIFERSEIREPD